LRWTAVGGVGGKEVGVVMENGWRGVGVTPTHSHTEQLQKHKSKVGQGRSFLGNPGNPPSTQAPGNAAPD